MPEDEKTAQAKKNTDKSEIRMDKKVTVRSIAPWNTGAARRTTSGDISISPMGTVLLSREEVIAQGQNGNTLLTGIDGAGDHATWYVEDEFCREELGFEGSGKTQQCLTMDEVKRIFNLQTTKAFEENIQKRVVTRAEKYFLMNAIKKLKFNDYERNSFCENLCGMRLSDIK